MAPAAGRAHGPLGALIESLDRRLQSEPENAALLAERGEAHRAAGHPEAAARDLDRAEQLAPDLAEVWLYRGLLWRDLQRHGEAWEALSEYVERAAAADDASVAYALTIRAAVASELGRVEDALDDLRRAIERQPGAGPELYLQCAQLILDLRGAAGRGEALAVLDRGIERLGSVVSLQGLAIDLELALGRPARAAERAAAMQAPPTPQRRVEPPRQPPVVVAGGASATLVRRPYLQLGTATSGIVRWRTSVATASRLEYGPSPTQLIYEVIDSALVTDHVVTLAGLTPGTRTYYAVGSPSGRLAGGDSEHHLDTAPAAGAGHPTRIWVVGDSGTRNSDAAAVRDAFLAYPGAAPELFLMLGDNAYGSGTDSEYTQAVFDFYPTLLRNTWLWPAIGNHDAVSADSPTQSGPYFATFSLPAAAQAGGLPSGTEAYYSFDWADIHFVVLDSQDSSLGPSGAQMQWLAADLASRNRQWLIAFWHHPPYSKGSHDSDDPSDSGGRLRAMRQTALPLLEAAGVDLVLTGHSHSYERSYLLQGHYGTSDTLTAAMILDGGDGDPAGNGPYATPGAVYAVAGSSGQVTGGSLNHPAMVVSLATLGSLVLDVAGGRLDAVFLDDDGVVRDAFSLVNHELFRNAFERGSTVAWSATY